jgi:ADP-ribose pyrophosphatase YjhB (NUDIX family)
MRELHIVAALVRRGDELLMVRQAGPGEEPVWSIPGGRVEPGEFVVDALERELREETGVRVVDRGALAFLAQMDDRRKGYFATVWTWDVAAWEGDVAPADPDGFVREAAFVPLAEAVEHLRAISWQPLTVRYLLGELGRGSLWLRRVRADGTVATSGPY